MAFFEIPQLLAQTTMTFSTGHRILLGRLTIRIIGARCSWRASVWMRQLYGLDFLQRFAFAVFPRDKTICVTTMYDGSRRTRAREFSVSCEHQMTFLFSKHTFFP